MEKYIISGIQQIGVGTTNIIESWKWYAEHLNIDIRILEDDTVAERMLPYTGNAAQKRHAAIAVNLQGGGGFEIWQYSDRKPQKVSFDIQVGDLGIFAGKIKSCDVQRLHAELSQTGIQIGKIHQTPDGTPSFFFEDPFGNYFQVVQDTFVYIDRGTATGGCVGAMIGVTNIERALPVYQDILGYDTIVYDKEGTFDDLAFMRGGEQRFRRVLLKHSEKRVGAFAELFGNSTIELVCALERQPRKIYEGRYWGDPGFIQICYDVSNMKALKKFCAEKGFPFTVDSCPDGEIFPMGDASGHFTYIEDPDGTLIEFVETRKIPVLKKLGIYIDLSKKDRSKSLPKFLLKMLKFNKVKFDK